MGLKLTVEEVIKIPGSRGHTSAGRGLDTSQHHRNERHCGLTKVLPGNPTKVLPGDPEPCFTLAAQESISRTVRASEIATL